MDSNVPGNRREYCQLYGGEIKKGASHTEGAGEGSNGGGVGCITLNL